ncbi:MAG: asparagine synthase (glutamine-hydrolyzing) [Candidatus Komeilibacteria bacterium RIFCSPLOWO2_02_FULL_48_11]|uniref:asparagine synthase (glutamine-hydrolyzing) n=1 Tax=Candidatus Komeilibacteria bacterium RIFCSPLOWO2_02_FULL_48_11 TaxID=1798553 RepID=A0A1G2BNW4_9BACT|nr:MAG: asparagine synthase (glutamine-hydrolyzing) [Candidatus Komeilibacteria bacterium RIFCSPLOWO2_02_FULL_48_11]
MCGITGFIGRGDASLLKKMSDTLTHRGPDGEGFYYQGNVGLGHRRLSIIDVKGGAQPIYNEDKTIIIVFNGEIYNFQDLKQGLLQSGHKFTSQTDTEVIVHLYEEAGESVFAKLNGMFAIAIWDSRLKKIILGRDRLGKKPLYYSQQNGNFVFASELKALMPYPDIDFVLDQAQLRKYFFYDYIPCPHTPWKNVYKLGPAEYLVFDQGKVEIKKYWRPNFQATDTAPDIADAQNELDARLRQAVASRLVSDVPLGIFLSGGIDSSTIAWYASQDASQKIKTFSIDFKEKTFGEGKFARQVAKHIGSDHYEAILTSQDALDIVAKVGQHLDEPLADASVLPTYLLSDFTKKTVTVALGGDGADELFCGYQTFQAEYFYGFYRHLPALAKKILTRIVNNLPMSGDSYFSLDFKLRKFVQAASNPLVRHQNWLSTFSLAELPNLFMPDHFNQEDLLDDITDFSAAVNHFDDWSKIIAFYQRFYMQERVLVKVDRASMLASLEVRAPFLDYELADFVNHLPLNYKIRANKTKFLLKELMAGRLPPEIIGRPKKGFAVPLAQWFRSGNLNELWLDLATPENVVKTGILSYNYVDNLFKQHLSHKQNNGQKLWSILTFLLWQQAYLVKK